MISDEVFLDEQAKEKARIPHVLIIDDEMCWIDALRCAVEGAGFVALGTYDLRSALELVRRYVPEFIVMDTWFAISQDTLEMGTNMISKFRELSPSEDYRASLERQRATARGDYRAI